MGTHMSDTMQEAVPEEEAHSGQAVSQGPSVVTGQSIFALQMRPTLA